MFILCPCRVRTAEHLPEVSGDLFKSCSEKVGRSVSYTTKTAYDRGGFSKKEVGFSNREGIGAEEPKFNQQCLLQKWAETLLGSS